MKTHILVQINLHDADDGDTILEMGVSAEEFAFLNRLIGRLHGEENYQLNVEIVKVL